jgi:hypothetical protein
MTEPAINSERMLDRVAAFAKIPSRFKGDLVNAAHVRSLQGDRDRSTRVLGAWA